MGPEPIQTTEDETLKPTRVWYSHARDRSSASDRSTRHRRSVACGPSTAAEQKSTPPRCRTLISRHEECGAHDAPDRPRTDGGTDVASPYIIPTGPGYLTTRRLNKGGVTIPVQETALDWAAGDTVTVHHPDTRRLILTRDADERPTVATLPVYTRQDRAHLVHLRMSVLKHLGLNPSDDARVYTDPDQDRLVVVAATDDPRIHAPTRGGDGHGD